MSTDATTTDAASAEGTSGGSAVEHEQAQRVFSKSMLVSAVRCTLTYVVLPFLAPFISFLDSVGPVLGITIGLIAIVANVYSIRRFWRAKHPWRKPITALHVAMICLLLVMMAIDLRDLF